MSNDGKMLAIPASDGRGFQNLKKDANTFFSFFVFFE